MPQALRSNSKAAKIAYAIIGKPENLKEKSTSNDKDMDDRLVREKTYRVR